MRERRSTKVTARVTPKARRLIEAAADEAGETISSFTAAAVERAARRELASGDSEERELRRHGAGLVRGRSPRK